MLFGNLSSCATSLKLLGLKIFTKKIKNQKNSGFPGRSAGPDYRAGLFGRSVWLVGWPVQLDSQLGWPVPTSAPTFEDFKRPEGGMGQRGEGKGSDMEESGVLRESKTPSGDLIFFSCCG